VVTGQLGNYLVGLGGLLLLVTLVLQATWPTAAVGTGLAGLVAYLIATTYAATRLGRLAIPAIRSQRGVSAAVLVLGLIALQVVAVIRPEVLRRPPGLVPWLALSAIAVGTVAVAFRLTMAIRRRQRRSRHAPAITAAVAAVTAAVPAPLLVLYPVTVPTEGALFLSGLAASSPRHAEVGQALAAAPVDLVVVLVNAADPAARPRSDGAAEVVAFPVPPGPASPEPETATLVEAVVARLAEGARVVLADRTGAEPAAVVAAAVCVRLGLDPATAWAHVEACRGVRPMVTMAQLAWLDGYAASLAAGRA
jgi:hypothetical protein